jgi:predicted esterase
MQDKMASEKKVTYNIQNTYSILNEFGPKTKNIWLVFHGMGYLSRYFIRYFKELNAEENYIIAPQAQSKYYQGADYTHVGSSWLTKENTKAETKNVLAYIDAVWQTEEPSTPVRFIILGYSQGVSIATRWMASRKIQCDELVLHSGGIPKELEPHDFKYLWKKTKVTYLYGNEDQYITEARKTEESLKGNKLFGDRLKIVVFKGIHEIHIPFLQSLVGKY